MGDETIVALDPDRGTVLWRLSESRVVSLTMAARGGKVCYHNHEQIVCLDLQTGHVLWKADSRPWPEFTGTVGTLLMDDQRVYYACDQGLKAWTLADGELAWQGPKVIMAAPMHPPDLFLLGDTLWIGMTREMTSGTLPRELSRFKMEAFQGTDALGLDPQTGEIKRRVPIGNLLSGGHHVRCYRGKATSRYLIWSKRGADFVDTTGEGNHARIDWTRGECDYGFLPCNGLFYTPPHPCVCYSGVLINGFNALSAVQTKKQSARVGPGLEKGPAYAAQPASPVPHPASDTWPSYRHDARRSGNLGRPLSTDFQPAWSAELGGKPTQGTIAGGTVIVAAPDQHLVHALDVATGERLWSFRAGGRVDSPPTIHRKTVLFGSHDGHVYCLRLADGELSWRFRAAPQDRWIVSYGQVESAWPVTGSVLLLNDSTTGAATVYFVAGRSSFLDGGLYLYGLDPATGDVKHRRRLDGPWPDVMNEPGGPHGMEGARGDILVSDGVHIFLGANVFNRSLETVASNVPQGGGGGVAEGPLRLSTTMGFLADDFYDRQHWIHHQGFLSKSMPRGGTKSGYLLVFDEDDTYTLNAFHTPTGQSMNMGGGPDPFLLSAESNDRPMGAGRGHLLKASPRAARWSEKMAFFGRALLLADDKLFVAGTSEFLPGDDPSDDYLANRPAQIRIFATGDGAGLAAFPLQAMPVFDGMSAAGDRIFLSCLDGSVRCLQAADRP
jgi:outer membrane protein assembly factor BamB